MTLTQSQKRALVWLAARNGTGIFARGGKVLIAAGAQSPFMHTTWHALRDLGLAEIGNKRLVLTHLGLDAAVKLKHDKEAQGAEDDITERDSILYGEGE